MGGGHFDLSNVRATREGRMTGDGIYAATTSAENAIGLPGVRGLIARYVRRAA